MPIYSSLTTTELIRHVSLSSEVTPLEMELLSRLVSAMDEIDALLMDIEALEAERGDSGG